MPGTTIISVHFPKAAGSSLAAAFRSQFGGDVFHDYDTDPLDPLHDRNIAPRLYGLARSEPPDDVRVIHGHFHPNKYIGIRGAYRLTFLREPVDNLISIYYFWRQSNNPGHALYNLFKKMSPDIFEFSEFPLIKRLMSQTYFGDVAMSDFNFVGFHERRAIDLTRLSTELGFEIESEWHENRTSAEERESRIDIMSDHKAIKRLRRSLADDCAFYDRLRERWE